MFKYFYLTTFKTLLLKNIIDNLRDPLKKIVFLFITIKFNTQILNLSENGICLVFKILTDLNDS